MSCSVFQIIAFRNLMSFSPITGFFRCVLCRRLTFWARVTLSLNPRQWGIVKLAKAFEVSVDFLLGEGVKASFDKEMLRRLD